MTKTKKADKKDKKQTKPLRLKSAVFIGLEQKQTVSQFWWKSLWLALSVIKKKF